MLAGREISQVCKLIIYEDQQRGTIVVFVRKPKCIDPDAYRLLSLSSRAALFSTWNDAFMS